MAETALQILYLGHGVRSRVFPNGKDPVFWHILVRISGTMPIFPNTEA
jgi:hypothetical protein